MMAHVRYTSHGLIDGTRTLFQHYYFLPYRFQSIHDTIIWQEGMCSQLKSIKILTHDLVLCTASKLKVAIAAEQKAPLVKPVRV